MLSMKFSDKESGLVHDLAVLLAPVFGNNPRRIKQFLNVLRLRALIAHETGGFRAPRGQERTALTLEQLEKFVALSLRFPLLVDELSAEKPLLAALEAAALRSPARADGNANGASNEKAGRKANGAANGKAGRTSADVASRWLDTAPKLRLLMRTGLDRPDSWRYSLAGLEVLQLLRVSPPVRPTAPAKEAGDASPASGGPLSVEAA